MISCRPDISLQCKEHVALCHAWSWKTPKGPASTIPLVPLAGYSMWPPLRNLVTNTSKQYFHSLVKLHFPIYTLHVNITTQPHNLPIKLPEGKQYTHIQTHTCRGCREARYISA